ncbi:MAG: hypothetical protein R3B48_19490 [Kofleriaceae bacterium]
MELPAYPPQRRTSRPSLLVAALAALATLAACGRVGFEEPAVEGVKDSDPGEVPTGDDPAAPHAYDRCESARRIGLLEPVLMGTVTSAHDDLPSPPGCGDGPEVVLRFTGPARTVDLEVTSTFQGSYIVGQGCPLSITAEFSCAPLFSTLATPMSDVAIDENTYLIVNYVEGAGRDFALEVSDAAP